MSFAEKKLEIFIAGFVLMLMWGVGSLMKNWSSPRTMIGGDIVYEMPRPKSFKGMEFDLSDREIDRRFVNPFDKKKAQEKVKAVGTAQKNAIAAKAAQEAAKKVAAAKAAEAAKKAKVSARVIERTQAAGLGADGFSPDVSPRPVPPVASVNKAPPANESAPPKADDKMSPDQWRALILAQPTKANIDKMAKALASNDLDQSSYFGIVSDLLKSTKSETQAAGIYAAQVVGNSSAFAIVAQSEANLNEDIKNKNADAFFKSYAQVARFNALAGALRSNNQKVVLKALETVSLAKTNLNITGGTGTGGSEPGTVSTQAVNAFKNAFGLILTNLAKSDYQPIASLANSLQSA